MLDYFALILLFFVAITLFYGIIAIHDIPYEIAKHRNHPHQDAIHVAGWISLFFLSVLWPFLWIWATIYREERGWGFTDGKSASNHILKLEDKVTELNARISSIESSLEKSDSTDIIKKTDSSNDKDVTPDKTKQDKTTGEDK